MSIITVYIGFMITAGRILGPKYVPTVVDRQSSASQVNPYKTTYTKICYLGTSGPNKMCPIDA